MDKIKNYMKKSIFIIIITAIIITLAACDFNIQEITLDPDDADITDIINNVKIFKYILNMFNISQKAAEPIQPAEPYGGSPYYEPDIPILLNRNNLIPNDYDPDLVYIDDTRTHMLNSRAAAALADMIAAARKDGVSLGVVSAYRSNARQTNNFNNNINKLISDGRSYDEAYWETARYIAIPGTSEHEAGLAVDFNLINAEFDQSREFAWLMNNCADYGFILRYPKDTEHITHIIYEPWHYRYVGINHAKKIAARGITLDEYVIMLKSVE